MRVQPNNNSIRMLPFDEYNHYAILSMAEADGKSGYLLPTVSGWQTSKRWKSVG